MGDDLADMFAASFQVSSRENNPDAPHPRFSQYKSRGYSKVSQEERQRRVLATQKQRRFDSLAHVRCLTDNKWDDVEEEDDEGIESDEVEMEVTTKRPGRSYKDQLMLSEWMLDVPADFAEAWLMVPCPVGRRVLIVAAKGFTKAFHRNGRFLNSFRSALPGGSKNTRGGNAILDCIYVESERTYYVLDLMTWKDHPIYDTETEFRFYWLHQKLAETPGISELSKSNQYKFLPLLNVTCTKDNLEKTMAEPFPFELDGLLFFHMRCHYLFGPTPLVLWLKAYMMPELLQVSVPQYLLDQMPQSYQNFAHHVETVDREEYCRPKEHKRRERRSGSQGKAMDVNAGFDFSTSAEACKMDDVDQASPEPVL